MNQSCSQCLYDQQHPFGMAFQNGQCLGCITHQEKYQLNWPHKEQQLRELLSKPKSGKAAYYDCVIPVQGDAEDYFVVNKALILGLRPLLVSVNDYFKTDIGWHNLHQLITYFDLDSLIYNPELPVYKELIRKALRQENHILWPALALASAFPVHIAHQRKIPLVLWGQQQSIEQVGKFSHQDQVQMSDWNRLEHDLLGLSVEDLVGTGAQLDLRRLNYYRYPDIKALNKSAIKGLYLSNYYPWDPLTQNQAMRQFGFIPQQNQASFDCYERAGSSVYYQIHDLLKLQRQGYRKVRDQLVREIRHGRIDRQQALDLERRYTASPVDLTSFFDWLGVTRSGRQWFIEHRLSAVQAWIGSDSSPAVRLPESLRGLSLDAQPANRQYLAFGKGI